MMFPRCQHILVPTDLTHESIAAIDFAFELAVQNQSRVDLLHVIEAIKSDDSETREFLSRLQQRADSELESLSQRFSEANVNVACKTRIGKRASEIVMYANEHPVDLIVMNSHRVDLENPESFGLGSISHQVSVFCPCPVLLVK